MKIGFLCGHCRSELAVPATIAGQKARCPHCQAVVLVPSPEPPPRPKAIPLHTTAAVTPAVAGPAWEVVEEPSESDEPADDTGYTFRDEPAPRPRATRRPAPDPEPAPLPTPSRPARPRRFPCRQCKHLIHTTTRGAFVECPRCGAEHSADEVKDGAKRWSATQRRMRERGDTPETMWQSRFLWYYLAGMGAFAVVAAVVLGVSGGGLAGAVAGFGLFLGLPLAFVVMSFIAMGYDARRGESLGLVSVILLFLFFGLLFLLLYSLTRLTRYPQLILAFLLWPGSLLCAFLLLGLSVTLNGVFDRGRNAPPPRPEFRPPPAVSPPKPALPPLPKYTPPGDVDRADEIAGAVSYWRFDEGAGDTANDSKSLATGTLRGARWVPGVRGTALEFDGRADWFEFGPGVPLRFGDNAPFTVSCWVKPKATGHGPVFSFRGEKDRIIDTATIVGVWLEKGKLCAWVRRDGSILFPNEQFGPDGLVSDVWHHVAVVRHRGGTVEVYQDGALAATRQSGESDGAFTLKYGSLGREMFPHHRVGERDDPTTKHLEGAVDEFAAFGRALTPAEIARLAGR